MQSKIKMIKGLLFVLIFAISCPAFSSVSSQTELNTVLIDSMGHNLNLARKIYLKSTNYKPESVMRDHLIEFVETFGLESSWADILVNSIAPDSIPLYGEPAYKSLNFSEFSKGAKKAFIKLTGQIFQNLNGWVEVERAKWLRKHVRPPSVIIRNTSIDSDHWMRKDY